VKERINDKSTGRVVDCSGNVEIEIRNQENRTAYTVYYNEQTYEIKVHKFCLRTLNTYDKFNQTRLDELKKEVEEYQTYMNSANNLVTQLRAEYLIN
jgi:S-adenosylmethionine hydrolase